MEPIESMNVKEYLEQLAEPSFPGPASGSAAATIAGMAVALLEMSCKVTMKKSEKNIPIDIKKLAEIRQQCLDLATEDMEVLNSIIQAGKHKKKQPHIFESAIKKATDTLVTLVKNCDYIIKQAEQLILLCDRRVYAELMGSISMAESAQTSAKFGVEENLKLLSDEKYKENVHKII